MIHLRRNLEAALDGGTLAELRARLRAGAPVVAVGGATGGARALTLAAAVLAGDRPYAVVTPSGREAEQLAHELDFLLSLLAPEAPPVVHLPEREVDPYRGLSMHPDVAAARAQALWRLGQDGTRVLVASIRAAAVRLPSPAQFRAWCLELRQGDEIGPDAVRDRLVETGYVEDDPVTEPGEFSIRGGIIDLFSPQADEAARLEFFGDRLESIRVFDPETQRSVRQLDAVEIIPMRELCPSRPALRRWAVEATRRWQPPFDRDLEEELAQASRGELFAGFEFLLPAVERLDHTLFDYLAGFRLARVDAEVASSALARHHADLYERFVDRVEAHKAVASPEEIYLGTEEVEARMARMPRLEVEELAIDAAGAAPPLFLACQTARKYHGNVREAMADLAAFRQAGDTVVLVMTNLGRAERVADILKQYEIPCRLCRPEPGGEPAPGAIQVAVGSLHDGFYLPPARLRVLTGADLFDESDVSPAPRRGKGAQRGAFVSDFRDLRPGDYVVHIDHGIGQYHGLKNIGVDGGSKEFVLVTYQDDARLYVPVERLDLIQKYSSVGGARPTLDRLGGTSWARTKTRIKKSMRDMAGELLKLYAERQTVAGHGFSADTAWQQEFEDAFEFEPTADQTDAIAAVKHDMEAPRPMDRLLCGDVGYGKTEVAMRAAFKAVMDGKQVAVLTPTTVLAFQHFNTFTARFTTFPVRIQLLSRFRSPKEQKQTLDDLELGRVDVVIGTHRLLSKDVAFRDLGLVVVDEEQRFGVAHKERLKALKTRVDVLTLSATPIPRTLHMALLGLRDMSTIETPPKNRLAIQTAVVRSSPETIRSAIELELERKGQVYFVHNRVETIDSAAATLQQLVPRARIGIAHGQMSERDLERVMMRFVQDELDILVATTIIENGLDIPRVNTIVVNRADLYGLAQLYQLRGRVGRSDRRAYAYLLVPSDETLSGVARKRLAAMREFSDLGAGFRVAALDLEIRGAGNLLGGEQHGHIDAVGFDLYCRLLEQAVEELRGEQVEPEVSTSINLNLDIRIPESYVGDSSQRLRMYKRISSAADLAELDALRQELVDRFGQYPESVEHLFRYAEVRQSATALAVQAIERGRDQVVFRFMEQSKVDPAKLLALVRRNQRATFSPGGVLSLELPDPAPRVLFDSIRRVLEEIQG